MIFFSADCYCFLEASMMMSSTGDPEAEQATDISQACVVVFLSYHLS